MALKIKDYDQWLASYALKKFDSGNGAKHELYNAAKDIAFEEASKYGNDEHILTRSERLALWNKITGKLVNENGFSLHKPIKPSVAYTDVVAGETSDIADLDGTRQIVYVENGGKAVSAGALRNTRIHVTKGGTLVLEEVSIPGQSADGAFNAPITIENGAKIVLGKNVTGSFILEEGAQWSLDPNQTTITCTERSIFDIGSNVLQGEAATAHDCMITSIPDDPNITYMEPLKITGNPSPIIELEALKITIANYHEVADAKK